MCNATQVETCDGECSKWVADVDISDTVSGISIKRGCSETCIGVNVAGNGLHCCDDMDMCNTATTTAPFIAFTMAACALVAYAARRQ